MSYDAKKKDKAIFGHTGGGKKGERRNNQPKGTRQSRYGAKEEKNRSVKMFITCAIQKKPTAFPSRRGSEEGRSMEKLSI